MRPPASTYRIQFQPSFTFDHARRVVAYLRSLGIGDLYASPLLRARSGSTHGYDVTDPTQLNPELGGRRGFDALVEELRANEMGLLLDMVPNHMAMSSENPWWMDVLENGRASTFAAYFDIDWEAPGLEGKVLVPILGAPYAEVLERGELTLELDAREGSLSLRYFEHRLPLDPRSYGRVLDHGIERLHDRLPPDDPAWAKLNGILREIGRLPSHDEPGIDAARARHDGIARLKQRLRELLDVSEETRSFVEDNVRSCGGDPSDEEALERLDNLVDAQAYVLAYWKAAPEEIDYRRFFDIADLVAVRSQEPAVFRSMHGLVLDLVEAGAVTGLRVDHVDGLHDPQEYLERLRERGPSYVVVEKILGDDEALPRTWPAEGTTGYEVMNDLNSALVDPSGVRQLERVWRDATGDERSLDDIVFDTKRQVMEQLFASEVQALSTRLQRLARGDRRARDVARSELQRALVDVTAALPVYRTYVREEHVRAEDRRVIDLAVERAAKRASGEDAGVGLDFLRRVLLMELPKRASRDRVRAWLSFVMRWQQFSGPVMAKGFEDTALYVYNPLVSRNDVGGEPGGDPLSVEEFHRRNAARLSRTPASMVTTSTHDAKRSEDVRARIDVLSEIPEEWERALESWRELNASLKQRVGDDEVPDPNEELLLYQTLLGAWPLDGAVTEEFTSRIHEYVVKAAREAKVHTSWIDPHPGHEEALQDFATQILHNRGFLEAFRPLQERVAFHGMLNSLSQTLLKICSPGVPDFYQGTELWNLRLVDPDNRAPVDFERNAELLRELDEQDPSTDELLKSWPDGRIKLWVTSRALRFRRDHRELFEEGEYIPLDATGERKENVISFARRRGDEWAILVAPRLTTQLSTKSDPLHEIWGDTTVSVPPGAPRLWTDILGFHRGESHSGVGAIVPAITPGLWVPT